MMTYERIEFRRTDTGETSTRGPWIFGPGAMYWEDQFAYEGHHRDWDNDIGKHLVVVTPSGRSWDIDSRASNCTLPEDRMHRCWIRHGVPPNISVDKVGRTCSAGAGSIVSGAYHGYLRNGEFVGC